MNDITDIETLNLFKELIQKDPLQQILKAAEECSELAAAITKFVGLKGHGSDAEIRYAELQIFEEMADVAITQRKLRFVFDNDKFLEKMIHYKLSHLKEKCNAEKHGEGKGD